MEDHRENVPEEIVQPTTEDDGKNEDSGMIIKEGKVEMIFTHKNGVFYNPVQEFNRDLSICVIQAFLSLFHKELRKHSTRSKKDPKLETGEFQQMNIENETQISTPILVQTPQIKIERPVDDENDVIILEALAASGLRAIRYALEIPQVYKVIANDVQNLPLQTLLLNAEKNNVLDKIYPTQMDAVYLMHQVIFPPSNRVDIIDLDPYGSASIFFDSALQAVTNGGLLCVTCTDLACLCGNYPDSCLKKYGCLPLKAKFCHELALRIVLASISSHAARYKRSIRPLLSISVDFYIRLYVRVFDGSQADGSFLSQHSYLSHCSKCYSHKIYPLKRMKKVKPQPELANPNASCSNCGSEMDLVGPIWSDRIHDLEFVTQTLSFLRRNEQAFNTRKRMIGLLSLISEELMDSCFYYVLDEMYKVLHFTPPSMNTIVSGLLNLGYQVSLTHCKKNSLKTNASSTVVWHVLTSWVKNISKGGLELRKTAVNEALMNNELLNQMSQTMPVSFEENEKIFKKKKGISRFPLNPLPYWGPMARNKSRDISEVSVFMKRRRKNREEISLPT